MQPNARRTLATGLVFLHNATVANSRVVRVRVCYRARKPRLRLPVAYSLRLNSSLRPGALSDSNILAETRLVANVRGPGLATQNQVASVSSS